MLRVGVNIFLKAFNCRFFGIVFVNFSNYCDDRFSLAN